jgi:hypothetical protein
MFENKMRLLGMSALVGAGLVAASPSLAYELRLGGVDVNIGTTVSAGMTYRMADRDDDFLPSGNGGIADTRAINVTATAPANPAGTTIVPCTATTDAEKFVTTCSKESGDIPAGGIRSLNDNYDGSLNTDDGRLNFDNGDITSAVVKFTSDIEADLSSSLSAFARVTGFYDAALSSEGTFERSTLSGASGDEAEMRIRVLDAFLTYDFDLFNQPVMVRAGRQVINWGESTFFLGGNSAFNPIDVEALVKPGAEIKDALLPVEAIYASVGLPYDLTLEAYVGGHSEFEFVKGGTGLSNVDAAFGGGGVAGQNLTYIGGGPDAGGNKFNCNSADSPAEVRAVIDYITGSGPGASLVHPSISGCTTDSAIHLTNDAPVGQLEAHRASYEIDTAIIRRGKDEDEARDNMGLAIRWYSEALNSTEFGFYWQNYTSRLPYVKIRGVGAQVGISATGYTSNAVNKTAINDGTASYCGTAHPLLGAMGDYSMTIGNDADDHFSDPYGLFAAFQGYAALNDSGNAATYEADTFAALMAINCALSTDGANTNLGYQGGLETGLSQAGENFLTISPQSELVLQYPEDIEAVGMSFNTTVLGWGVQGDFSYRRNMPLQVDTDSLTIATYSAACVFELYGIVGVVSYKPMLTTHSECNTENPGELEYDGFVREEVYNWDIGTTATFTRSNPITAALGADLMIFLTEFAGEYAPDVDDYRLPDADETVDGVAVNTFQPHGRLAGRCTSGSDLGLGGLVGLDERPDNFCRPTGEAIQGLFLLSLQYNNVFGSPWSLSPQVVYREGLSGVGATPGSPIDGVSTLGLSLNASLQSSWTASLSYTDFGGDELWTRNTDKDQLSVSISRAF